MTLFITSPTPITHTLLSCMSCLLVYMHISLVPRPHPRGGKGSGELGLNLWACTEEFPRANQISVSHMTGLPQECNITIPCAEEFPQPQLWHSHMSRNVTSLQLPNHADQSDPSFARAVDTCHSIRTDRGFGQNPFPFFEGGGLEMRLHAYRIYSNSSHGYY